MYLCQLSGWFLLWHVCFRAFSPFVCGDSSSPSTERSLIINLHGPASCSPVQSTWLLPRDGLLGLSMFVRASPWKYRGYSCACRWVFHSCWYSLFCLQRPAQEEKGRVVKMCNKTPVSPVNAGLMLSISCQNRLTSARRGQEVASATSCSKVALKKKKQKPERTADLVIIHYGRNGQFQDT